MRDSTVKLIGRNNVFLEDLAKVDPWANDELNELFFDLFMNKMAKTKSKERFIEVLKLNPSIDKKEFLFRGDGRIEWQCEHGTGHTVSITNKHSDFIHGCDGCCKKIVPLVPRKNTVTHGTII